MAKVFCAVLLLSGILAVSGCAGLVPDLGALGSLGGGYPAYGGPQAYPYDPGPGGSYAQPVQPYYQPQPYVYYGNPEVYAYQPDQPVPPATPGYTGAPPGHWQERRQPRQEDRFHPGRASGQMTPREARGWHNEPGRFRGRERRTQADGNLSYQERGRSNAMPNRRGQDVNRLRHNRVQPGPTVQSRPGRPGRPMAELRPGAQPRAAAQPRGNGGRSARQDRHTP